MGKNMEDIAIAIGQNEAVVDMLDVFLNEPDDRAYVVCSAYECLKNVKGHCSIHMVKGRRRILSNGRCADYVV
jgi:hypothetical protein